MQKLAAVSVDLDEIDCYAAIHGLTPPPETHAIYDRAVPRLAELFDSMGIRATFFAIGKDLARTENGKTLRALHQSGHEIANHSMNHYYDLTRRSAVEMRDEVREGIDSIERAVGERPVGFRAPGYTINDVLVSVLGECGVSYDSSVFPCPAYWFAKTSAIGAISIRGRKSHSIVDDPRVLSAPADPYRMGEPYWRGGSGLVELPIGVTRNVTGRLPFIGTSVALAGETGAKWLARAIAGRPLVSLELHGIDLADSREDGLDWLAPHQPDLRKTAQQKRAALVSALQTLRDDGYEFVTCANAAQLIAP